MKTESLANETPPGTIAAAEAACAVAEMAPPVLYSVARAIRVHQWVKNLLVFGALLLSHRLNQPPELAVGIQAFLAFCLVASSGYVCNDLLDLRSDRRHATKKNRPFASGALPPWSGALFGPVLGLGGLVLAGMLSRAFLAAVALYFGLNLFYSLWAKQKIILDVILLSGLYSIRLFAGGIACRITISKWTLAYSTFCFLSLALLKRYAELITTGPGNARRGYQAGDSVIVGALGCVSGLIAALPLALYAGSPEVLQLYRTPDLLWLLCCAHIYWVSRIWLMAHRGEVHEDPVLFAMKDPTTYGVAAFCGVILALAV